MKAAGETLRQVHWPLISMAAFLIIHQDVCVSVCVFMSGAVGPVRLCEMMSALRHIKQVQQRHSTACDQTQSDTYTREGKHTPMHVSLTDKCVLECTGERISLMVSCRERV